MSSTALDRDYGTFEFMGAAALREGRQHEAEKLAIRKSNDLVDDYNNLVDTNSSLRMKLKQAREDFHNERHDYNALVTDWHDIRNIGLDACEKLDEARKTIAALRHEIKVLESEKKNLNYVIKSEAEDAKYELEKSDSVINGLVKREEKAIANEAAVRKDKFRAEWVYSTLYKGINLQQQNDTMALKVAFVQAKILKQFNQSLILAGKVTSDELKEFIKNGIDVDDTRDKDRDAICYTEALNWLRINNPTLYAKLV